MEIFLEIAVEAATSAGKLLRDGIDKVAWVKHKGEINLVTEMDIKSEHLIKTTINRAFPDHQIMAEESDVPKKRSAHRWIVDPLDGTTNYAHGFYMYCVSIALEIDGVVELGVVYDPVLEELFTAIRGRGATMNGKPLKVSQTPTLTDALLVTGFPYDLRTSDVNNLDNWNELSLRAQALRRLGSAALDLCYVAMGRFEGFWELKLYPWDVAAGALIVEEAGGTVTAFGGEPFSVYAKEILATNGKIHPEMVEILMRGKRA